MARYYNRSSGPVAVTLTDGSAVSIPGRSWAILPDGLDGSGSVAKQVRKGTLVRAPAELVEPVKAPEAPKKVEKRVKAKVKPPKPPKRRGRPRKTQVDGDK